ncbi:MAG: SDR family oxidoreductase [Myxococcota bacterium]
MVTHPFNLQSKTVLVVGASSGIGAETARMASHLGADVILASRSIEKLEAVRDSLAHSARASIAPVDYLDSQSVRAMLSPFEKIDHVMISAVADENKKRGPFVELDDSKMKSSFDKFWGQINVLQAVAPKMPDGGSATLFASVAGIKPSGKDSGLSVMNGVQSAVIQLGRSLALELSPIRVNVVAPGVVLTGVWQKEEKAQLRAWMEADLPVKRAGLPEHIAHAVIGLMTNPYITGAVLPVDGGLHLS